MYRLSRILILCCLFFLEAAGQNTEHPHGNGFAIDCASCHNAEGWTINEVTWDHGQTGFDLDGQHQETSCVSCHNALNFTTASSECTSCHVDVHQGSVGNDCMRCHTTAFWIVSDVQSIHEDNGFPLDGAHFTADCNECHTGANELVFQRLGTDCAQCHTPDFLATSAPNHQTAGFGMDCASCHDPLASDWGGENFHTFFPLEGGHGNVSCTECHTTGNYQDASPECASCHLADFNATTAPNHQLSGFPTDCALCHDNSMSWEPAAFLDHDAQYFPIYSGNHKNEWSSCTECHTNQGNFALFSCIDCHEHNDQADLAGEHNDVNGYVFESNACYQCHPDGDE